MDNIECSTHIGDYDPFLWDYLGGSHTQQSGDPRHQLFDVNYWSKMSGGVRKLDYVAQYIMRYRVLDILVDVMGAGRHTNVSTVPRISLPVSTTRIDKIQSSLHDWMQCISKFESMMTSHDRQPPSTSTQLQSFSTQGRIVHAGVFNLISAQRHISQTNFNKALLNLELTAFALSWYVMVSSYKICISGSLSHCFCSRVSRNFQSQVICSLIS